MKIASFLFFFLMLAQAIGGQTEHKRDSFLQIAHTSQADTARVWGFMSAGKLYIESNPDSAILYLQQAQDLAEKIGFEKGIVRSRINKANAMFAQGKFDEAIELDLSTLPISKKLGLGPEQVSVYNLIGNAWNQRGSFWLAIDYYDKALEAMKTAKVPPQFPVVVNNNLAIIYNSLKLYDKALEYATNSFEKAVELVDDYTCATSCEHIGNAYLGKNNEVEAYSWFEKAVEYARKAEYPAVLTNCLGLLADLEMKKGNLEKTGRLYNEAYETALASNDNYGKMTILHGMGLLAFEKKDFAKAEDYCQRSLKISNDMDMDDYRAAILLTLSDVSLVKGDFKHWDLYRSEYQDIRDTLSSNALIHAVQELDTKYETQAKEQKIKDLEQEKELQTLRLQRQRASLLGVGLLAVLLFWGGIFAWRFQKNKALLAEQQNTIQAQTIKQLEQEKQIATASAVMRGQEEERGRLARDLHDGLGGMLSGIKQTLFAMKGNQVLTETSATSLNHVIADMDKSIGELRHIARNMMPEALVRFGLKDALEDYCDHSAQSTGLKVHFQSFGMEERLPQDVEVIVFRIAQELLNNVLKHANASQAIVQLIKDENRVNLTVEDDGKGMDTDQLDRVKGVGWMNIRSRVNYLAGRLDVHSMPGKGLSVGVEFDV